MGMPNIIVIVSCFLSKIVYHSWRCSSVDRRQYSKLAKSPKFDPPPGTNHKWPLMSVILVLGVEAGGAEMSRQSLAM